VYKESILWGVGAIYVVYVCIAGDGVLRIPDIFRVDFNKVMSVK
jgi:hypothetical protein